MPLTVSWSKSPSIKRAEAIDDWPHLIQSQSTGQCWHQANDCKRLEMIIFYSVRPALCFRGKYALQPMAILMASIHHNFTRKQVGDTKKARGTSSAQCMDDALGLCSSPWPQPRRGSASVPTSVSCQSAAILMKRCHCPFHYQKAVLLLFFCKRLGFEHSSWSLEQPSSMIEPTSRREEDISLDWKN